MAIRTVRIISMSTAVSELPRHPYPPANPAAQHIQDTWKCSKCSVIRGLRSGWKIVGQGKSRRRICIPCWELTQ